MGLNRDTGRDRVFYLLGEANPAAQANWTDTQVNEAFGEAVTAFSNVSPARQRTIAFIQKEVHKVEDTTQVIAAADATTQATVNTLLNEIKTDYGTHLASTTYHRAADTTNTVSSANASDLATSLTLANELRADINAHFIESGVHMVDDIKNLITDLNAVDLTTVLALANQIKKEYTDHLSETTDGRNVYVNAVVGDSSFIRIEGIEYPVNNFPAIKPAFDWVTGNFLYLKSDYTPGDTGELVFVFWHKLHTFSDAASTIPIEFEDVVILGAVAYSLLLKSRERVNQSIADLATARTEIAKLITGGFQGAADINAALDLVATYITGASAPSVLKYLTDGDAFLNTINVGDDVAPAHSDYALKSAEMAKAYIDEALARAQGLDLYSKEAERFRDTALTEVEGAKILLEDGNIKLREFRHKLEDIDKLRKQQEKPVSIAFNMWCDN